MVDRRIKGIRGFGERWCLWAKGSRSEGNLLKKVTTLTTLLKKVTTLHYTTLHMTHYHFAKL